MSLDSVLNSASSGLDSASRQIAIVSQNVANASTAGYVRETVAVTSFVAGGDGMGVTTGPASRSLDQQLQSSALTASALVVGEQTRSDALASIDAASGTPGAGFDLPSLLGTMRDAFTTLQSDPANAAQQRVVVNRADTLARGVNALAQTVSDARQTAQDAVGADVTTANTALRAIGTLSDQIIAAKSNSQSTADLEDQRDRSIRTLSDLTGARVLLQPNGDALAVAGGLVLPLRATTGPFALGAATLAPDTPAAAVPQLTLGGVPVANQQIGGRIGANLALRDTTLPDLQSGLDQFAQSLASQFDSNGLTLFTDAAGAVPGTPTDGFAQGIQVSAAVVATPSMLRDGAGSPSAAGDTTLINGVLDQVLGSGTGSLVATASALISKQAGLAADSAGKLATGQAVQTSLDAKLAAGTGVSLDTETANLVRLQNAYAANAKVISASQAMWTQLLAAVV